MIAQDVLREIYNMASGAFLEGESRIVMILTAIEACAAHAARTPDPDADSFRLAVHGLAEMLRETEVAHA